MLSLLLTVTIVSFSCSIAWLVLMYKLDKHKPEPYPLLVWLFILGVLSTLPAGVLNSVNIAIFESPVIIGSSFGEWLVGFVEEGLKFLAVYIGVRKTSHFDEPLDGVIYAATAALGFSFAENVGYLLELFVAGEFVLNTIYTLVRGSTSFLHVLLSSIWGMAYAAYRLKIVSRNRFIAFLLLSAILHSAYNATSHWSLMPVLIGGAIYFYYKVKHLNRISPENKIGDIYCPHCDEEIAGNSLFCKSCGKKIIKRRVTLAVSKCPSCEYDLEPHWKFCKSCGETIKRTV